MGVLDQDLRPGEPYEMMKAYIASETPRKQRENTERPHTNTGSLREGRGGRGKGKEKEKEEWPRKFEKTKIIEPVGSSTKHAYKGRINTVSRHLCRCFCQKDEPRGSSFLFIFVCVCFFFWFFFKSFCD